MRFFLSIIITCVALLLSPTVSHAKTDVTGIRISKNNGDIRLVVNVSNMADYKLFTVPSPNRLVLDIPYGKWKASKNIALHKGSGVKKIRHGIPKAGVLRVVLDLSYKVKIKDQFFIMPGKTNPTYNLVILLKPYKVTTASITPAKQQKNPTENKYAYKSSLPLKVPVFSPLKLKGYGKNDTPPVPDEKPKAAYRPLIVIDAGHGGVDPGAIGKGKTKEKHITLKYAKKLADTLSKTGKYRVLLTRSSDKFISLKNRVAKAQKARGDLFISLHADSHPNSWTRGLSVYTISESRAKREVAKLVKKARKEEVIMGIDLKKESKDVQQVLIDLAQRESKNTSSVFAGILVKKLGKEARLLRNTHRFAGFAVLTGANIPSVLVELGYLSNRTEERLLKTTKYRNKLVKGIAESVKLYFKK